MNKVFLVVCAFSLLFLFSCGNNKVENAVTKKDDGVQSPQVEQKMTLEKACKLENELATLLMQNYWHQMKDKDYQDVKDLYSQYSKEKDAIYNKYGVSTGKHGFNVQSYIYWKRDNRGDMRSFRKEHPEYDFYVRYPEFSDANVKLYEYATAEYAESRKN